MLLLTLHLLNPSLQLINQNLLLVKLLLQLFHSFQLLNRRVSCLSFSDYLSFERLVRLFLFFLLRCNDYLIPRDLLLQIANFVLRDNQLTLRFASVFL